MKKAANNTDKAAVSPMLENSIEARVFRTMAAAVALAVIISLPFAPWRVTVGLLTGGLLSLVNHHWLRTSIAAAFNLALGQGTKPRVNLARYILRYFLVAAIVVAAYKLNIVSLPATVAGLCSFVVALFVEALREIYFVLIHREEIT